MSTLVTFLHVVVCLILVGTVLLQQGKGGGMGGAFGGANAATVFGSGGASTFLRRMTAIAATIFMITSMVLAYVASNDAGDALKSYSSQQAALKKRKKDAEKRALEGATLDAGVADPGTEGGEGEGTGAAPPADPTGADVDDGDTGEDSTDHTGSAAAPAAGSAAEVPSVVDEPAPAAGAGTGTGAATP